MINSTHDSVRLTKKETERVRLRMKLHSECAKVHENEECKQTVNDLLDTEPGSSFEDEIVGCQLAHNEEE